jgi:hypothetical protein
MENRELKMEKLQDHQAKIRHHGWQPKCNWGML